MIIESIGTTGSGKTALIPILVQLLSDEGRQAMSLTDAIHFFMRKTWVGRLALIFIPASIRGSVLWRIFSYIYSPWYMLLFAIHYPRLMGYVVIGQLRRKIPWSHRLLIVQQYLKTAGRAQFFKHYITSGQVIFIDEGFVHRATHLFASEVEIPDPRQVLAYLELLPSLDLVMWVRAPLDLCLSRINTRGAQFRLVNLSPSDVRKFLLNSELVCQIAAQYIKQAGWPIVEVDNINKPEESADQLCQSMKQYLNLSFV